MEPYSRYIVSRLLKKSKITSILKAEGYLYSSWIPDMKILMDHPGFFKDAEEEFSPLKSIIIPRHTLERWNQRVGPVVSFTTLKKTLEVIFKKFTYRVSKLDEGIGVIDNEIVFTYEITDKEFYITTFYGRKSLQPALNQMKNLRNYNFYQHDQVNLALTEEELSHQLLPLIPREVIHFNGKKTTYILEKYQISNRTLPCFLCYKKEFMKKNYTTFLIDLENREHAPIPRNVLCMLNWLGYGAFVLEYYTYHHPEKVIKARDKARDYFNHQDLFFN
jgi:hypothetical protein